MAGEALTADGVFSGGGVKGLAFAGALKGAAEAGYGEWHELAGTSAGAITAMALAAGYDAARLSKTLDAFDFGRLADYGSPIHLLGAIKDLIFHESIVKGDELTNWIGELLDGSPVRGVSSAVTFGELQALTGRTLVVVGTDLAHSRMVVFPQDVDLYEDRSGRQLVPDEFPVAKAVRISAGYPYFFPPVGGLWDRSTKEQGVFVDGGVAAASRRRSPCSCSTSRNRSIRPGAFTCTTASTRRRAKSCIARSAGSSGRSRCSKASSTPRRTPSTSSASGASNRA
jgi:NTE family protein